MNLRAAKAGTSIYEDVPSPIGRLRLIACGDDLTGIWFEQGRDARKADGRGAGLARGSSAVLELARSQLAEYFLGQRREFDLPLAPAGTDFQRRVWQRLLSIEYGATTTYGALAADLGNANASRAVGLAN